MLAASGGTYDWVVFRTMMRIKYVEDIPEYIDGWPIDVVSLLRWEGYDPEEEYFKENKSSDSSKLTWKFKSIYTNKSDFQNCDTDILKMENFFLIFYLLF